MLPLQQEEVRHSIESRHSTHDLSRLPSSAVLPPIIMSSLGNPHHSTITSNIKRTSHPERSIIWVIVGRVRRLALKGQPDIPSFDTRQYEELSIV